MVEPPGLDTDPLRHTRPPSCWRTSACLMAGHRPRLRSGLRKPTGGRAGVPFQGSRRSMRSSCLRSHCCPGPHRSCPDHTPTFLRSAGSVAPAPRRPPRCQDVRPPVVGQRDRPTASGRPGSWGPLPLGSFVASLALRLALARRDAPLLTSIIPRSEQSEHGRVGGIPRTWSIADISAGDLSDRKK
jgi:hypothetical protein